MAYSKNITIDENGPRVKTNSTTVFSDVSLSIKDFSQSVESWSSNVQLLNKGDEINIDGNWNFLFIRLRWLDNPNSSSTDGALSIYNACTPMNAISTPCGCDTLSTLDNSKTATVPSLATLEMSQYTEYVLNNTFGYLDTSISLGINNPKVTDLYDNPFNAVLSGDILYFQDVTIGPVSAIANPYPANTQYYSYTNQNKDVLFVYDIDANEWVLLNTDTDISLIDSTENYQINIIHTATWSSNSNEIGNSASFTPELSNSNGDMQLDRTVNIIDNSMPVSFKFSDMLVLPVYNFTGKIISELDNQEINIMLGK